jgi:hypothetical protein
MDRTAEELTNVALDLKMSGATSIEITSGEFRNLWIRPMNRWDSLHLRKDGWKFCGLEVVRTDGTISGQQGGVNG